MPGPSRWPRSVRTHLVSGGLSSAAMDVLGVPRMPTSHLADSHLSFCLGLPNLDATDIGGPQVWGPPVHDRTLSGIPDLGPLDASDTRIVRTKDVSRRHRRSPG